MFNFLSGLSRRRRHRNLFGSGMMANPLLRMVLSGLVALGIRRYAQRRRTLTA